MRTKSTPLSSFSRILGVVVLGILSVVGSFTVGVKTAGDVQTIGASRAEDFVLLGDMNGNQKIDTQDVIIMLEIARGYRVATPSDLRMDPNGDGIITIDDALRVLKQLPQ